MTHREGSAKRNSPQFLARLVDKKKKTIYGDDRPDVRSSTEWGYFSLHEEEEEKTFTFSSSFATHLPLFCIITSTPRPLLSASIQP